MRTADLGNALAEVMVKWRCPMVRGAKAIPNTLLPEV